MQRLVAETDNLAPLPQAHVYFHTPAGDPNFAGVKWHVDLNGNEFPFSRGCSFYEVGFGVASSFLQRRLAAHTTGRHLWALQGAACSFCVNMLATRVAVHC